MINDFFNKYGIDAIKEDYLNASRLKVTKIFRFPSEDIQVITNGLKGEATATSGLEIFTSLREILRKNELKKSPKILDYGCGWGRITCLLPTLTKDENVHGVDVDSRLIIAASNCFHTIKFNTIESMGYLPFETGSFDLIFANSVFSHLSEQSAISTLAELVRIVSPSGLIIISVLELNEMNKFYSNPKQSEWIDKILGSQDAAIQRLSKYNFVWGDTNRWDNYGIAIMNDAWLKHHLANLGAELVDTYRTNLTGSQNYKIISRR